MVISLQRGHKPEEAVCFKLNLSMAKSHLAKSWPRLSENPTE